MNLKGSVGLELDYFGLMALMIVTRRLPKRADQQQAKVQLVWQETYAGEWQSWSAIFLVKVQSFVQSLLTIVETVFANLPSQ